MANIFLKEPFKHQKDAVASCHNTDMYNYAYLMEMGTGKTLTALIDLLLLNNKDIVECAVVLAPKSVYRNWMKEINTFISSDYDYKVNTWDPSMIDPYTKENLSTEKFFVAGRESKLHVFLMNIESLSTPKGMNYLSAFLSRKDLSRTMMIVDESTTIKTPTAKRTKNLIKITKDIAYKRILTGTPVTKSPLDIYTQFAFLDTKILGQSNYYAFRARYAKIINRPTSGGRHFPLITGYQRLEELEEKIYTHAFRVKKEECTDLPDKVYQKRFVTMSEKQLVAFFSMIHKLGRDSFSPPTFRTQMNGFSTLLVPAMRPPGICPSFPNPCALRLC